ncbi:LapA family protein [Helicovermis profundi]|uniref:Lipopolysaccharide assembly protein A domain-containing protein n=1 Tax=Helicovermis profundi TaxID=3065157 RepID=A0AAU9EP56_9FIRM|nr:hypothetical protein HLPR_14520 [Clostridia bacterium S502]
MQFTFIISLLFAIIVALFALLNAETVTINVLFSKFQTSQAVVILVSASLGAIVVYLLSVFKKIKSTMKIKESEKKFKTLEKDYQKLSSEKEELVENNDKLLEENEKYKAAESQRELKVDISK